MLSNGYSGKENKAKATKSNFNNAVRKYRVHCIEVSGANMQEKLEQFINKLDGEVISVIPNVTHYFLMYGARVNCFLIVEKVR